MIMYSNTLIISFCLCIARLNCSVYGNDSKDAISTETEIDEWNNFFSRARNAGITRLVIRALLHPMEACQQTIAGLLRLTRHSTLVHLSNFLGFLASSDNNNVIPEGRGSSHWNSEGYSRRYGGSFAAALSRAFMMPFKIIFGSLRSLPVTSIYEYLIAAIPFIDIISENPVVQWVSSATASMAEAVIDHTWIFTKANLLPWMDKAITNLHKSSTLPDSIMHYLNQLQSFYHICHYLGIL